MKEICLEELKKIELEILIYIDKVCKENGLRYSLCDGTLLGAVRHNGFIPWDDDIDIMMPRPDYDKFLDVLRHNENRFKILSSEQEDYYYTFSKVVDSETMLDEYMYQPIADMGVYVDVFPLEGMPSNSAARKKHFNRLHRLRKRINSFSLRKPKIRKNLIAYAKTLYLYQKNKKSSLSKFQKEYEILAKQYNFDESEYTCTSGGAYGKTDMFPKRFVADYEERSFEGKKLTAIKESVWRLYEVTTER